MYSTENDNLDFIYPVSEIFKGFIESGINVYKINSPEGIPDIETYEDYFPFVTQDGGLVTPEMKQRLLSEVLSRIAYIVRKLASESYTIIGEYKDSDTIRISVRNHDGYDKVDKEAADVAFRDMVIYGALLAWTKHSAPEDVKAKVTDMYSDAENRSVSLVKKLECVLLRKTVYSPIFDNMIKE